MKNKLIQYAYILGAISAFLGYISFAFYTELAPYLITIGGAILALCQLNSPYRGSNLNIKRLYRHQIFGSLFIIGAGACMRYTSGNEWIMLTTIAAIIYLYTSFRISSLEKTK